MRSFTKMDLWKGSYGGYVYDALRGTFRLLLNAIFASNTWKNCIFKAYVTDWVDRMLSGTTGSTR